LKVIFNTDQIYLHGGIEKVIATKANNLVKLQNFEVYIITTEQKNNNSCYKLDSKICQIDLAINYNRSKSYFSVENLQKVFKHFFLQRKILKRLQPDILISPNYNFDHFWLPYVKPSKTKLIKEIHASGYYSPIQRLSKNFANKFKWWLNDKILSNYDCVVVLNEEEKSYQKIKNVEVIPNPIIIPKVQAILENKQVLAAGRISPVKGFDQLILAWKLVHQKHPTWQLHIYGEAYVDTKVQLQNQINESQLQDVIFFKDSVDNLQEIMLEYSIYVLSSITECFPMVLLEAISVGLPIVSYDCPNGPRHIITNKNDGLLVANQNIHALVEGLFLLMENEIVRKKMGANAKKNAGKFEVAYVMQLWLNLFDKLNKNKS
jgi:glycosyltransferase involved in cell wall biosynthesis